jgi:TIR domain
VFGVRVFVSYRRSDVGGYAGRLNDILVRRLGQDNVFHDVTAIAAGRDFTAEIDAALASSDAVLAVIGPGWLTAGASDGRSRLFDPDDILRRELVAALGTDTPMVPVLVGGAGLPSAEQLPAELAELTRRQAVVIRDDAFHEDVDRLLRSLRGRRPADRRFQRRLLAAGLLLAVLSGAVVWWWRPWRQPDGDGSGILTGCPTTSDTGWETVTLNGTPSVAVQDIAGTVRVKARAAHWRAEESGTWDLVVTTELENGNTIDRPHTQDYYQGIVVARREFQPWCFDTPRKESVAPGQIADGHVGFLVTCSPTGSIDLILNSPASRARIPLHLTAATTPADCRPA